MRACAAPSSCNEPPSTAIRRPARAAPARAGCAAREGPRRHVQSRQPLPSRHARSGRRRLERRRRSDGRRRRAAAAPQDHRHRASVAHDHHAQRFARRRLHAVGQSLSGLRAWLHLLLRAAIARVPRPFARHRFRDATLRQGQGPRAAARGAGETRLSLREHHARHQHRWLPADRARMAADAAVPRGAARMRSSGVDRDEVGADRAGSRSARADGGEGSRRSVPDDHHARPRDRTPSWSRALPHPSAACRRSKR